MTVVSFTGPARPDCAFGTLFDLARLQTDGWAHADVCDVCNTLNMGSARLCKCCAHKLPAFYASEPHELKPESAPPRLFGLFVRAAGMFALLGHVASRCHEAHLSFIAAHFASPVDALE